MKNENQKIKFQATFEQAQAIMNALYERFQNIHFWVTPTGLKNNYFMNMEIRLPKGPVSKETIEKIDLSICFAMSVFEQFDKIVEGDNYDYSTQKNFD